MTYSEGLKKAMVEKLLGSENIGITALSKESGIPPSTLFGWKEKYCSENGVDFKVSRSPRDLSLLSKYEIILESASIKKEDFGKWLRSKGLQSEHLEKWKGEIRNMASKKSKAEISAKDELKEAKQKIKELECELRRKEKALAEASALLLLKKKADALWGEKENFTV